MANKPLKIAAHSYFVGEMSQSRHLHANPYLLYDGKYGILFEPGSILDFESVKANVESICDLSAIKYVILSHEDPDLASSLPLFVAAGLNAKIITDRKNKDMLLYYEARLPFVFIDDLGYQLTFLNHTLHFINTPFVHGRGAFVTYDATTKILFSGDMFGAYGGKWKLFADESYYEPMKTFHELYVPSSDFISPAIKNLSQLDINMIAPQHGSIIKESYIKGAFNALLSLDYTHAPQAARVSKKSVKNAYNEALVKIIKRLEAIEGKERVMTLLEGVDLPYDGTVESLFLKPVDHYTYNAFFDSIAQKDKNVLLSIELLIYEVSKEFDIDRPVLFNNLFEEVHQSLIALNEDKENLVKQTLSLKEDLMRTTEMMTINKVTNLYNEAFFRSFMATEMHTVQTGFLFIALNELVEINRQYGNAIGDETLSILAYFFKNSLAPEDMAFKYFGPNFIIYLKNRTPEKVYEMANNLVNQVKNVDAFIAPVSLSIGIVYGYELEAYEPYNRVEGLVKTGEGRLSQAKFLGKDHIVDSTSTRDNIVGSILLVDEDEINQNIVKKLFERENFDTIIAHDVYEAITIIQQTHIDAIVSEINLSKLDGFALKQRLNQNQITQTIPFIMVSHNKNQETIKRANALNVDAVLNKPFHAEELMGFVKRLRGRRQ